MNIRIKRYYQIVQVEDVLYCGISKKLVYKIDDAETIERVTHMVPLLKGEHDIDGIARELQDRYPAERIKETVELLFKKGVLEYVDEEVYDDFEQGELDLHNRNMLFYDMCDTVGKKAIEYQRALKDSTVVIWGLHGVGAQILLMLCQTGIGHIRGIDGGKVDKSHLNSKILYQYDDIGKPKGEVLSGRLKELNPFVDFEYIDYEDAQADNMAQIRETVSQADCVVFCLDLISGFGSIIDEMCVPEKIPYIMVGKREGMGISGPFCIPGKSACYLCNEKLSEYQWEHKGGGLSKKLKFFKKDLVFSPIDTLLGNYAVIDIVKYLSHLGKVALLNKQFLYDVRRNVLTTKSIYRQVDCPNCRAEHSARTDGIQRVDEHLTVFDDSLCELGDFVANPVEEDETEQWYRVSIEGKSIALLVNRDHLMFLNLLKNAYTVSQAREMVEKSGGGFNGDFESFLSLLFCSRYIKAVDGYRVDQPTKIDNRGIYIVFNDYNGHKDGEYYEITLQGQNEQLMLPEPSWNAMERLAGGKDLESVRQEIMKLYNVDTLNINPLLEMLMDKGFIKHMTIRNENPKKENADDGQ